MIAVVAVYKVYTLFNCQRDRNPAQTRELAEAAQCSETLVCAKYDKMFFFHLALYLAEQIIEHFVPYSRSNQ